MMSDFNLVEYLTVKREKGIIVWLCNIGAEKYWNPLAAGMTDRQEDVVVNRIEEMNLLICRKQDVMILREKPDGDYLKVLEDIGFQIPGILTPKSPDLLTPISELVLRDEKLQGQLKEIAEGNQEVYFVPYAVTYLEEKIAQQCGLKLVGAASNINSRVNDKIFNREIAEELEFPLCKGKVCNTIDEVREEYYKLVDEEPHFDKVIIKEPCGASGKGLYIIDQRANLESKLRIISRFSRNNPNARWLVEGWYDKKADVNYQICVSDNGAVDVFSMKQQLLNDTVYIGSKLPPDISEEAVRAYRRYGEKIGKYLFGIGYRGVAGVDSFITSKDDIIPIIEINGRFTLSTYLSFLHNVMGDTKIVTRYFRVITASPRAYKDIYAMLKEKGICYEPENKEGVVIYTAGTLPGIEVEGYKGYMGRIFALVSGKSEEKINCYIERLEELMSEL